MKLYAPSSESLELITECVRKSPPNWVILLVSCWSFFRLPHWVLQEVWSRCWLVIASSCSCQNICGRGMCCENLRQTAELVSQRRWARIRMSSFVPTVTCVPIRKQTPLAHSLQLCQKSLSSGFLHVIFSHERQTGAAWSWTGGWPPHV